ncbi:branched-chain amino acid ABC transporter permease [Planomonospora parontospora]|uniref:branched-chain amino acid ABC transporter permease n=1 Tax=Planomonospora parontospora TaxID=58119 RepID=UPI00167109A2|nr:branched-chain amino acid ABC transporter permease [Planomonospora parontospora]GGL19492.1 branched-chain amino acid ABC transporter permease [Planomonospora parontospora subsp. antibiotica]GII13728.1 branched-chain amino acid ABC transporter permease [Planomonospora parontospora subsp. antibiotica]
MSKVVTPLWWVLVAAGVVVAPFYLDGIWLQDGLFAMAAAIGAIGLNLLTGATGQLSMGHAFFLAVGAFGYVYFASVPGQDGEFGGLGLPTPLAAVLAVLLAGVAGGLFSPIAGRLKGAYLGIATLALIFIGHFVMSNATPVTGGHNGRPVPPMELFGFAFTDTPEPLVIAGVPFGALERLWFLGVVLLVGAGLFARGVLRGRPGRAMNTIRDHEIAAGVMGVPVTRYRAGVFVLSSMYGGLAGVLIALVFRQTVPDYFGLILALSYLAMIIIGGLGSVAGAVIGAFFVSMLPSLFTRYSDALPLVAPTGQEGIGAAEAAQILYGLAVVVVVLFLPGGLFGLFTRARLRLARRAVPAAPVKHALTPTPETRN